MEDDGLRVRGGASVLLSLGQVFLMVRQGYGRGQVELISMVVFICAAPP
jgi:hypothetical protein